MKIAWFTPFAKDSAIGHAGRLITDALAKSAEVDIWYPRTSETHCTALRTVSMGPSFDAEEKAIGGYDIAVYNVGNHFPFHRQIFEMSRKVPGIVVLHDFVMHHFVAGYYLTHRHPHGYVDAMQRAYGDRGGAVARKAIAGKRPRIWETDEVIRYPLFEEVIRGAWAVVAHSEFLSGRVADVFAGPVKKLGLAYSAPVCERIVSRKELGIPEGKALLVSVGHSTRFKGIHFVLEGLGRCPEIRNEVIYRVIGHCDEDYRRQLDALVARYGLEESVQFPGYVSEQRLASYLAHADLCVNFRHPAAEGASAAVIEQMLLGKPVIVANAFSYRELPDECVRKVDLSDAREGLAAAIRALVRQPALRRELGERAKRYAETHFRADDYASGIMQLAEQMLRVKPMARHTERIGAILEQMGVSADMSIIDTVSRTSLELFCEGDYF